MEILFISHKYPPSVGGMEKQSFELINGASKYCKTHKLVYNSKSSKLLFLLSIHKKIRKILKENPGITHIHLNDGLLAFFCNKIKKICNLPVFVTIHGLDIVFPNKWYQKIISKRLKSFDGIIAVSQATADECIKRGIENSKVFVVKNGIDHDIAEIKTDDTFNNRLAKTLGVNLDEKIILTSLGRSVKRKGFSWFIKNIVPKLGDNYIYLIIGPRKKNTNLTSVLFKLLPKKIRKQLFLFMGYPTDEIEIHKELNKSENKGKVFHLGKIPFKDLIQTLRLSDLFIMPNIKVEGDAEGFGLVALEAAMCEKVVLASRLEGIKDAIIQRCNGYLVNPEDTDAWVRQIHELMMRSEDLGLLGHKAKEYTLNNYSWDIMSRSYIELMKGIK